MVPGVSAVHRPTMGMTGACTAVRRADCERARSRVTSESFPCGTIEHPARPGLCHRLLLEGGGIGDARWIEDGDIGLEALFEHAAVGEAETLRWKCRHLLHRALERQQFQLADVASEHAHERSVAARMWNVLAEHRHLAVRSNHRRRMHENPLEIFLADGVEDALAAALHHDPHR